MRSMQCVTAMMRVLAALCCCAAAVAAPDTGRPVLGYHTCGWGGSNSRPAGWKNYNWTLLTHIAYHSAVKLYSNGSLWFQPACGCVAPGCGLAGPDTEYAAIRSTARAHGVELLLSITELNATSFASTFLFDSSAREAAARNLVQLRRDSGAAGFGFDFEGPYITNATVAAAIVSFFAQVRNAGKAQKEPLLLLFPMGAMLDPPLEAGAWNMTALANTVDLIVLMCYDFIGGWAGVAGPNAPLTGGMEITDGRPGHFKDWKGNTKAAVSYYQRYSGTLAQQKLLVGVPWYGHEWATNGSGTSRADRTMRSRQMVDSPGANASRHRAAKYGRKWDPTTQTPYYAYRKEWGGSVGWVQGFYDDEQSLALKYDFIRSVPQAGVAIWAVNWGFATEPMWRTLAQSGLKSDDATATRAGTSHTVIWNHPWPSYCKRGTTTPAPDFSALGIRANAERKPGIVGDDPAPLAATDTIACIYTPKLFNSWPHFGDGKGHTGHSAINGGIPQRGDLSLHLETVRRDVLRYIPEHFSGFAVIDFEMWVPWGCGDRLQHGCGQSSVYANASRQWVAEQHTEWNASMIEAEALLTWNRSSLAFMVGTLKECAKLRPQAKWGYFGRPGCYYAATPSDTPPGCLPAIQAQNDAVDALWEASTALYPAVYETVYETEMRVHPDARTQHYVRSEIAEARRLRNRLKREHVPVMAYTWPDLHVESTLPRPYPLLRNTTDLQTEFRVPLDAQADGIIVWGSGADVGRRCANFSRYFNRTLGPFLAQASGANALAQSGLQSASTDLGDSHPE